MRALVTGATGFVGGHLVDALRRRGDDVTALVRSPAKAAPLATLGVRLVQGDLDDISALALATDGQDVVYHVAGVVAARNESEYDRANRGGTENLVRSAEGRVGRLVLVSSGAAGGPSRPGEPATEAQSPSPVTMYGRSKLAAENVVRGGSIPWVIVRPPTIYGPRDRENLIKVFRLLRFGVAPVFGDGSMEISIIYAPDLADALIAAAESSATTGHTYYVNHPTQLTTAGLVRAMADTMHRRVRIIGIPEWAARGILRTTGAAAALLNRPTILNADKANEFFQAAWTGDPHPFMRDTAWAPAHDLTRGLELTYDWYRSAGWL